MSFNIQGKTVTADMYGVNFILLDDEDFLVRHLCIAAQIAGATVLKEDSVKFSPNGVTVACILSESHITCHTYPEHEFIAIDCYTCGSHCNPEQAIEYLKIILCPRYGADIHVIQRGVRGK